MKRQMYNPQTGHTIEVKEGFSWTTLFFGLFVPLLRGDLKWAAIMFVLAAITLGLSWLAVPFFYNKKYIQDKLAKGYVLK
ncbi:MAG: HrgC protein [Culicoidibacterales bacterium]